MKWLDEAQPGLRAEYALRWGLTAHPKDAGGKAVNRPRTPAARMMERNPTMIMTGDRLPNKFGSSHLPTSPSCF
jgi:hypothetical protein